jgi:hypothetical protein
MNFSLVRTAALMLAAAIVIQGPASALSLRDFRRYQSSEKEGIFIAGAVSMIAFAHAANGDVGRAKCVQKWYFGGGKGPEEVAAEIAIAEKIDPDKFKIEGILWALAQKHCTEAAMK